MEEQTNTRAVKEHDEALKCPHPGWATGGRVTYDAAVTGEAHFPRREVIPYPEWTATSSIVGARRGRFALERW